MSTVTNVGSFALQAYPSPFVSKKPASPAESATSAAEPVDQVDIHATLRDTSETGRIALNTAAGNLTGDQTAQLYQQVGSIQSQIEADKQADGGSLSSQDAQTINQLQSQLSATIYSDAHNGAAPPSDPTQSGAAQREALQAGRIQLNEQAGNLGSSQAQQLMQQQYSIDRQIATDTQANGGPLTQAQAQQINQLQDQASTQIYQTAHNATPAT